MITKGIVEEILDNYKVKVRMPTYDAIDGVKDSVATKDLSEATICSLPNAKNIVAKGDIVFIGFEDNDLGKPVILGHLFKQSGSKANIDIAARMLSSTSTTKLSADTYIGDVTPNAIKSLKGATSNIQEQINNIVNNIGLNLGERFVVHPQSNYDCDLCFDQGLYLVKEGKNTPNGDKGNGSLLVLPFENASGNNQQNFCSQLYIANELNAVSPGYFWYRTSYENSWGHWCEVLDTKQDQSITGIKDFTDNFKYKGYDANQLLKFNVPMGIQINENTNLNTLDYIKVGYYYCPANAWISTLQNCPASAAFIMEVTSPISPAINNELEYGWVYRQRKIIDLNGNEYIQLVNSNETAGNFSFGAWRVTTKTAPNQVRDIGNQQGCIDLPNGTRIIYGYVDSVNQNANTDVTFYGGYTFASNPKVMITAYGSKRKNGEFLNGNGIAGVSTTGFTMYTYDYTVGRHYLAVGASPNW